MYVSRPQYVEAVQWDDTDEAVERLWQHTDGKIEVRFDAEGARDLYLLAGVDGAQKMVPVPVGHWVVHPLGDTSDIWPVENSYFEGKYERDDNDEMTLDEVVNGRGGAGDAAENGGTPALPQQGDTGGIKENIVKDKELGVLTYRCTNCGEEFFTEDEMNEHIDEHHNEDYGR